MSDLGGCGRSDYYIVDTNHPNMKEIYAMLLLAYSTDLPVNITATDCTQGISRVRHVQINRQAAGAGRVRPIPAPSAPAG